MSNQYNLFISIHDDKGIFYAHRNQSSRSYMFPRNKKHIDEYFFIIAVYCKRCNIFFISNEVTYTYEILSIIICYYLQSVALAYTYMYEYIYITMKCIFSFIDIKYVK